jgi:hypothetical protein
VFFHVPESEHNLGLGNFMTKVSLVHLDKPSSYAVDNLGLNLRDEDQYRQYVAQQGKILYQTSKPCLLQYRSSWLRSLIRWLKMPLLLFNFASEAQLLRVTVMREVYDEPVRQPLFGHLMI